MSPSYYLVAAIEQLAIPGTPVIHGFVFQPKKFSTERKAVDWIEEQGQSESEYTVVPIWKSL